MHLRTRGVALLSITAALTGGAFTTTAVAATASDGLNPSTRLLGLPILGDLLGGILGQITGATPLATVQTLISGLSLTQVGDLLQSADATQLTKLLSAADANGQLTGALGTLDATETGDLLAPLTGADLARVLGALPTAQLQSALATLLPAELAGVLGGLNPTQLTGLVAGLTPAQITGLLGAGGSAGVITGLLGQATGLAGGTPTASQVDALLAQVNALLGGGLPADSTALASLLTSVNSLLGTSGLSPAVLTSLLGTANGLLGAAPAPVAAPLHRLVTQITGLLAPVAGGGETTTPAPTPGTTTTPAATPPPPIAAAPRPAAVAPKAAAQFTGYRATVGALKLNRKRTSLRFTLTCASSAPKGCLVKVSAKVAGKSAMRSMTMVLPRGRSAPVTVTFSKSTTRRLRTKGGTLKITAQTALSSLPAASRTLKVKRLKTARKAVR